MKRIGIVGQGYVGTAVRTVFEQYYKVYTYDIKENCNCKGGPAWLKKVLMIGSNKNGST